MPISINSPSGSYTFSGSIITSSYSYSSASYITSSIFPSGSTTSGSSILYINSGSSLSASMSSGSTFDGTLLSGSIINAVMWGAFSGSFSGSLDGAPVVTDYSGSLSGPRFNGRFVSASYFSGSFASSSYLSGSTNRTIYGNIIFDSASYFSGSYDLPITASTSASYYSGSNLSIYIKSGSILTMSFFQYSGISLYSTSQSYVYGGVMPESYMSGSIQSGSVSSSYDQFLSGGLLLNGNLKVNSMISGSTSGSQFIFSGSIYSASYITGIINATSSIRGIYYTSSYDPITTGSGTGNIDDPTEVHTHNCPNLTYLDLSKNSSLKIIDIVSCSNLRYVDFSNNPYLESIVIKNCPMLMTMSISWNTFSHSVMSNFIIQEYSESLAKPTGSNSNEDMLSDTPLYVNGPKLVFYDYSNTGDVLQTWLPIEGQEAFLGLFNDRGYQIWYNVYGSSAWRLHSPYSLP